MLVLGIDSSTKVGNVSLISEEKLIGETLINLNETHSQRLMPQVIELLKSCHYTPQDLDGIGVTLGPGSFTGTRIGLTTGKTLAQSLGIPIVGISTLKAIAYSLRYSSSYICSMLDARRDRVFTCLYQAGNQFETKTEESLIAIDDLLDDLSTIENEIYFIGEAVKIHQEKIDNKIKYPKYVTNNFNLPKAGVIGELAINRLLAGEEDELFSLTPNYLKRSQAEIQWEKKHN